MPLLASLLLLAAPAVLTQHGCGQCHADAPQPAGEQTCAGCHRALSSGAMDSERERYTPAVWERFKRRTAQHFVNVPPLSGVSRLRASWVAGFLERPVKVRPRLSESMIRNRLSKEQRAELAAGLGAQPDEPLPPKPSAERLARGAARFRALGCPACHLAPSGAAAREQVLAPDLSLTRLRMNHSAVVALLLAPPKDMPVRASDPAEARLLADWLVFGEVPREARPEIALPPPEGPAAVPSYEEVEARVFKAVCWHCHSNPDKAGGSGGPGMTGGFGYPARRLSFASFEEVMAGSVGDDGQRRSIFRKGTSGEPVLLEVLRARYAEERGAVDLEAAPGMPLGLPALAPEDFALVERWIRGGRRPPRVKGNGADSPFGVR